MQEKDLDTLFNEAYEKASNMTEVASARCHAKNLCLL